MQPCGWPEQEEPRVLAGPRLWCNWGSCDLRTLRRSWPEISHHCCRLVRMLSSRTVEKKGVKPFAQWKWKSSQNCNILYWLKVALNYWLWCTRYLGLGPREKCTLNKNLTVSNKLIISPIQEEKFHLAYKLHHCFQRLPSENKVWILQTKKKEHYEESWLFRIKPKLWPFW